MRSSKRFLLDTQAFILAAEGDSALPPKARTVFLNQDATLYLSLVSLWEMQIKLSLGKLKLPVSLPETVQRAVTDIGLELLPLHADHIYTLAELPFHHRDPFDRLLVAQALNEQMPILGNHAALDHYGITRIW